MHRLSSIIVFFGIFPLLAQSPHGSELKIDCAQCHNPSGWTIDYDTYSFDHDVTDFPLEGNHEQIDCKACHKSLVFEEVNNDCISCHTDVHNQSVGNDCMRCHDSDSWLVFAIPEIHEQNGFPLIGAHYNLSCVECHDDATSLEFLPIGNECLECHNDDYLATQNPNHALSGFSTDCILCHDPLGFGWDAQNIVHDFFPLTQGHDIQDCSRCHNVNDFSDINADCFSCHEEDYNQTANPNHLAANFSTDCVMCHSTNPGWMPALIDHDFFPLTLGHDIQDCASCHNVGDFSDISTDCFACHESDYDQTTNPNHVAANFPTDCAECHTTNPGWIPAEFDHDGSYFPIYSGVHRNEWNDCIDCHINPSDYSVFTCLTCHERNDTDDDHEDVADYIYESNACLQCHPDGSE